MKLERTTSAQQDFDNKIANLGLNETQTMKVSELITLLQDAKFDVGPNAPVFLIGKGESTHGVRSVEVWADGIELQA